MSALAKEKKVHRSGTDILEDTSKKIYFVPQKIQTYPTDLTHFISEKRQKQCFKNQTGDRTDEASSLKFNLFNQLNLWSNHLLN